MQYLLDTNICIYLIKQKPPVVFTCANYDAAQTWLLEDEYEPIEGRLSVSEL